MNHTELHKLIKSRRPKSLQEVASWAELLGGIDAFLREFLDEFYVEQISDRRVSMLRDEPLIGKNPKANAYLAAVAEHLSMAYKVAAPDWVDGPSRFLNMPYFPCGLESLKATLLIESPIAFRRRLIFVDANPLYRPRRDSPEFGAPYAAHDAINEQSTSQVTSIDQEAP